MRAEHGPADVIVANNVMAHVPDLNDFVGGFAAPARRRRAARPSRTPTCATSIEHVEFDTIYHEHYCYFSCSSVDALMTPPRPAPERRRVLPETCTAARCAGTSASAPRPHARAASSTSTTSVASGMTAARLLRPLRRPGRRRARTSCARCSTTSRAQGRTVAAYGAAAKGATLLNSTGIGTDRVAYVVDRNVHKQGKLMPGCRLPIRPVEVLVDDQPDDLLLLAWNFADEIVAQQARVRRRRRHVLRAGADAPPVAG